MGKKLITRLKEENFNQNPLPGPALGIQTYQQSKNSFCYRKIPDGSLLFKRKQRYQPSTKRLSTKLRLQQTSMSTLCYFMPAFPFFGMKNRFCSEWHARPQDFSPPVFITQGNQRDWHTEAVKINNSGLSAYCLHPTASMPCSIRAMLF